MKEYTAKIFVSVTTSAVIVTGLLFSQSMVDKDILFNKASAEGVQLSPTLEVPDKDSLSNKAVSRKDVRKTIRYEKYMLEIKTTQAYLASGSKIHLGYEEEDMSTKYILSYQDIVREYSSDLTELGKNPKSINEILGVEKDFKADIKDLAKEINEDKFKAEAEALKKEAEAKKKEQVVTEVVNTSKVEEVSDEILNPESIFYDIPQLDDQYLTYEPYTAITAKGTPHYKLQQLAKSNEEGYRIYKGAVSVALASAYGTKIGTLYNITFEDGKVLKAILGDNKADIHTDSKHQYRDASGVYDGSSGNIVEIIFDRTNYGETNAVNRKINGDYPTKIKSIEKIGTAEGFE